MSGRRIGNGTVLALALALAAVWASGVRAESFTYKGSNSDWVGKLLTRVSGWKCPAHGADKGSPPQVKADACMRDTYVAAAVVYAWAAECYARQEEDSKATAMADEMRKQLKEAQALCSDKAPIGGGRACGTLKIYPCGG